MIFEEYFCIHAPKKQGQNRFSDGHELRPLLEDAYAQAEDGAVYVAPRYSNNTNLGVMLKGIAERAGVKPWGKPFQNLRSTRQTELLDAGYPVQAVCEWIGNSEAVAAAHYLQVTDQHYRNAVEAPSMLEGAAPEDRNERMGGVLQKTLQPGTDGPEQSLPRNRDALKMSEKNRVCQAAADVIAPQRGVYTEVSHEPVFFEIQA